VAGDFGMSANKGFTSGWGVITLLDFLGWKGIWMNNKKQSQSTDIFDLPALNSLADLIGQVDTVCKDFLGLYEFISISDTIAVFSPCDEEDKDAQYKELMLHSEICSKILDIFAGKSYALRGAITLWKYAYHKNIIIGPGVDECASWHDQTNWLGVIFAPSAQFVIDEQRSKEKRLKRKIKKKIRFCWNTQDIKKLWTDAKMVEYPDIPVKNGFRGIKYCVDWGNNPEILNEILRSTISLSQEIAIKYINTNKFLYEMRPIEKSGDENKQI